MGRLGWEQARIGRVQPKYLPPTFSSSCCGAVGEACARPAALF